MERRAKRGFSKYVSKRLVGIPLQVLDSLTDIFPSSLNQVNVTRDIDELSADMDPMVDGKLQSALSASEECDRVAATAPAEAMHNDRAVLCLREL